MDKKQLHNYQETTFDIVTYVSYGLLIISSLGFYSVSPQYMEKLDYYIRVYICMFLLWRFHPFRTHYDFTELDRKIAFSAGVFILTTTALNQYLEHIKELLSCFAK